MMPKDYRSLFHLRLTLLFDYDMKLYNFDIDQNVQTPNSMFFLWQHNSVTRENILICLVHNSSYFSRKIQPDIYGIVENVGIFTRI